MSSQVVEMRKQVDQLRQEANIERLPVSKAVEEMVTFVNQNTTGDMLVSGMGSHENPYNVKKSCNIL